MYTTLNAIRKHHPCTDGWKKLLKYLGKTQPDNEPLSLLTILYSNGFDDTLWCFRVVEGFKKEKLLLGIGFAREVEHLMPAESKKALDVFERYANGLATQEEFDAAAAAARAAVSRASAAHAAAAQASYAAVAHAAACAAAADAAWYASFDSVYAVAWAAALAAADAADAAAHAAALAAAWRAADAAARAAHSTAKAKQEAQLRQLLDKTCTQL